ncbi:odorant receptor Or2-like [Schistocerca gregaria]|uniref:odorant receptor Or2-like n=1 Tax=Schistocerca gregaria TaxID=7010 RepID=UPI00211E2CC8|nr:odorant receptor Or2-like [Schistocerca gregaria]
MEPLASAASAAEDAANLDYLLWFLHWSATLRHPRTRAWSARIFYLRYIVCVMILVYSCSVHVVLMWQMGFDDFDYLTLALCLLDTYITWIARLGHIAKHERDFHRLARQVRDDFGEFMAPRDVPVLLSRSRTLRRFVLAYLSLGVCDVTMWLTFPMRGAGLPLDVVLPFDTAHPVGWAAGWLYCAFITVHAIVMNMMVDAFNVSLMAQLSMQLVILGRKINDLANDAESMASSPPQTAFEGDEQPRTFCSRMYNRYSSKKINDHNQRMNSLALDVETKEIRQSEELSSGSDVHCRLKKIILHHQTIIRNVEFLQQCLGDMLLGQSLGLGIAICILLLQVGLSAQNVRETGKFGAYLCAMFTELSVYCWFGDQLMSESENVAFCAYDAVTSMQELPTSIKRSLLLVMLRAQRPLCITAAGLFPFSRESFVSILNVSYSFFAILRNFKEE